jgi:hypothetical protein
VVWSSGKSISIVFPALTALGREVIVMVMLDPADRLSLKVLKTHEPG